MKSLFVLFTAAFAFQFMISLFHFKFQMQNLG